jgi:hypothetical protein
VLDEVPLQNREEPQDYARHHCRAKDQPEDEGNDAAGGREGLEQRYPQARKGSGQTGGYQNTSGDRCPAAPAPTK